MIPEHMDIKYSGRKIQFGGKQITLLDRFVLDFIRVLEQQTPCDCQRICCKGSLHQDRGRAETGCATGLIFF